MTPEEIRQQYHNPVQNDTQSIRSCYHCSKCDLYFLYKSEKAPQYCQYKTNKNSSICGGILRPAVFPSEPTKFIKRSNKEPLTKCSECGKPTDRTILGIYICEECYPSDYKDDYGKNYELLNFDILTCGVKYHPEKIICKDCFYYKDCSKHYIPIDPKKKLTEVPLDQF